MIFLSDFLNAEVVDLRQHRIGRVRDLVVVMTEPFPRVTGVILKGNPKVHSVDWTVVRSWDNKELSLKVDESSLQPHARADNELWLSRQILDKQIVDMDGRRVVRVNDLQLSQVDGNLLLVGVDIGSRGLARRVGLEGVGRRLTMAARRDWPQKLISWEAVDPVKSDVSSVKLRIAHTKLAKLHPADIADIVNELSPDDRSAVFAALDDEKAADTLEEIDEPQMQASILERLDVERASDILEAMAPDEVADLLADMPRDRAQLLLQKMEEEQSATLTLEERRRESNQRLPRVTGEFWGGMQLYLRLPASDRLGDLAAHRIDRLADALAAIFRLVAVPLFHRPTRTNQETKV